MALAAAGPVIEARQDDRRLRSRQQGEGLGFRLKIDFSTIGGVRHEYLYGYILAADFGSDVNCIFLDAGDLGMNAGGWIIARI
jgi:hypothetical protein